MAKRFLTIAEFAAGRPDEGARSGGIVLRAALPGQIIRLAPDLTVDGVADDRVVSYLFSTGAVARDGHTIAPAGWDLTNFAANPVFLWAHASDQLPIGKVVRLRKSAAGLAGDVEYVDRDTYPFADTVLRLVRGGFLNATSVSWDPIKWRYATDKDRPGGIDFLEQDLLEISQVPVPAAPEALATARAAGIDTGPLYAWAEKLLDENGQIPVPRAELEALRRNAKMPTSSNPVAARKRGLYTVSMLAGVLSDLGYVQQNAQYEAEREGDDSQVPAMLVEAAKSVGNALIAMTIEEVGELVTALSGEEIDPDDLLASAKSPAQRTLAALMAGGLARQTERQADTLGKLLSGLDLSQLRAGKVLSSKNEASIREAHDCLTRAVDLVRGVLDNAAPPDPADAEEAGDEASRAAAERRRRLAAVAKVKAAVAA